MLREWIDSLRTDCPRPWRRLGYAHAAVACAARARRCAAAWAPHQARTRREILAAAMGLGSDRRQGSVLVLGAGPCLDVPVGELAGLFRRVVLADAAFPPAARAMAARNPAIRLARVELTGLADALAAAGKRETTDLPPPGCTAFLDRRDLGLVVSVNLLSQLPLLPLEALPDLTEAGRRELGRAIVQAHLDHLAAFPCPALLITDVERRTYGRDGRLLSRADPLFGLTLPAGAEWVWDLAPRGELGGGRRMETTVRALILPRAESAAPPGRTMPA
ncbi:MAG: hypothetical protein RLY86_338 [Pseudomonadota bacterium]|jgi:hypothetical protein